MSRTVTIATLLASEKLEQLQSDARVGRSDPGSGTDVVDSNGAPVVDLRRGSGSAAYVRQWTSARLPLDSSVLLLSVVVAPSAGRVPADLDRAAGAVRLASVVRGME
jgi:hypothetical protein